MHENCCAPARREIAAAPQSTGPGGPQSWAEVTIPCGTYRMGDAHGDGYGFDGETPVHDVDLDAFAIDATPVTNDRFRSFVEDTGYVTTSERFGSSPVFIAYLKSAPSDILPPSTGLRWWVDVQGADWRHPHGPRSTIDGRGDHPVVQVSHDDALAFAIWAGRRLLTEAEWEAAARGGLTGARYPWGDELRPDGADRCNIWEGDFPDPAPGARFLSTSPVGTFPADGRGVFDMVGNVWEWCADWFDPGYYRRSPRDNPRGPDAGSLRVVRGGSHLCHPSYCRRYRVAARTGADPRTASSNTGFRTGAMTQGDES